MYESIHRNWPASSSSLDISIASSGVAQSLQVKPAPEDKFIKPSFHMHGVYTTLSLVNADKGEKARADAEK